MADDILSAGLDISGFSPDKKKTLQEFIVLFDKLEKYDQKKFTPLSGDGLTQFNASLRETDKLLASINSQMANMRIPKSISKSSNETVEAVKSVKQEVEKTNNSIDGMGKSLNNVWGAIRRIAYIVPALGIAGIFNLAYEALEKLLIFLTSYQTKLIDLTKLQSDFSKVLSEMIELLKKYTEYTRDLSINQEVRYLKEVVSYYEKMGYATKDVLEQKQKLAKVEFELAKKDLLKNTKQSNVDDAIASQMSTIGKVGDELKRRTSEYLNLINSSAYLKDSKDGPFKAQAETLKTLLTETEKYYNSQMAYLKNYDEKRTQLSDANVAKERHIYEEGLKKTLETTKKEEEILQSKNKRILDDKRSTLAEQLSAIKSNYESERRIINANLAFAKAQRGAYNLDGTATSELVKSQSEAASALQKASDKYLEDTHRKTEEYRQRDLTAIEKMNKDELESNSQINEAVFKDVNKSLEERIAAYAKYIQLKSRIQDIEYEREKDREGLTPTEDEALRVNRDEQIRQLKANGAKQMYEIVSSWGKKQLDYVEDTNASQVQSDKSLYTQQVKLLNESFDKREITYLQYIQRKKAIDAKYRPDSIENEIENDRQVLKRLKDFQKEQLDLRDKFAEDANSILGQDGFKEAEAKVNAIEDLLKTIGVDISKAERDLAEDEYKYEEVKYNRLIALFKEYEENKKRIRESGFQFAETLIDNLFEKEERKLQLQGEIYNTQADVQKEALDRSSLNEKNKTAYSIQLEQQKIEFNKRQALEERRLRREQALFEQKLALARIAWNTQIAISSHLGFPPLILQDVIMGALAAATVLANTIPAYEEGTKGKPHPGGLARIGEKGKLEMVKEPGKAPYFVNQDQITNLPKGTEVFPLNDTPVINKGGDNSNWEQTMMIVSAIKKQKREIKNIIKPVTKIDMGWEVYKNRIING